MATEIKKASFDKFVDDKYLKLDPKAKFFIILLIFILPLVAFYFGYWNGSHKESIGLDKKVIEANKELKRVRAIARNLPVHQKEFDEVQEKFNQTAILLPKKQEIPNLLRSISDLGKEAGLDFVFFSPGVEVARDFYAEIPINIKINGPYHNLGFFLDKVSKLERIVTVNNIQMGSPKDDGSEILLNSSCRLLTYRFTNKKLQQPDGKKKKK